MNSLGILILSNFNWSKWLEIVGDGCWGFKYWWQTQKFFVTNFVYILTIISDTQHVKIATEFSSLSPTSRNFHQYEVVNLYRFLDFFLLATNTNYEFPEFILVKSCKMKGKRSNEQILLLYRLDCYNQFLQYQETAKVFTNFDPLQSWSTSERDSFSSKSGSK